jgi:fatty acid desaturase
MGEQAGTERGSRVARIEWPTVVVVVACWAGWVGVLAGHRHLPAAVDIVLLAVLGAWYMSIQHEVVHAHPTRSPFVNRLLAGWPLALWLPFGVYLESHLRHHGAVLADPLDDPETFLVTDDEWERAGRTRRALLTANTTLLGRMVLGPAIGVAVTVRREARMVRCHPGRLTMWALHALAAGLVAWVVVGVAGLPAWQYLIGFCYLGLSLTYVRSFAEHRAVAPPATRSAVVRSGRCFGLLFLWNNLHHTHHAFPGAPWYRLPTLTDELDAESLAAAGAGA